MLLCNHGGCRNNPYIQSIGIHQLGGHTPYIHQNKWSRHYDYNSGTWVRIHHVLSDSSYRMREDVLSKERNPNNTFYCRHDSSKTPFFPEFGIGIFRNILMTCCSLTALVHYSHCQKWPPLAAFFLSLKDPTNVNLWLDFVSILVSAMPN